MLVKTLNFMYIILVSNRNNNSEKLWPTVICKKKNKTSKSKNEPRVQKSLK